MTGTASIQPGACALEIVQTEAELVALALEWMRLWRSVTKSRATQAPHWCLHAWRAIKDKPGVELFVICIRIAGELVGVVPLKLETEAGRKVLKSLGLGYDEFAGVVLRDDLDQPAILSQVIDAMAGRGDIAKMSITSLPDESPLSAVLLGRKLAFTRWIKRRYFVRWAPDADWNTYLLGTRSKSSLKNYARLHNKLVAETGAELVRERDPAVIATTVEWLLREKMAAFEERGVAAFLEDDRHTRFMIDIASSGDSDNPIGVYSLRNAEKILAAVIVAHGQGTSEILMLAHDPEYAPFAAGRIVCEHSVKQAFDAKEEYDFGPGDHQWKRTWRTGEAFYRHVELYLSLRAAAALEPKIFLRTLPGRVRGKIEHLARKLVQKLGRPPSP